jgi:hypothetical protein
VQRARELRRVPVDDDQLDVQRDLRWHVAELGAGAEQPAL